MDIILIAAVTLDGFIARHCYEKVEWSQDLSLFKKQTMGHPVILGFNTFNSMQTELEGRELIVAQRNDDPGTILENLTGSKCFVAGGGKTNALFAPFLTHLYLTPHPIVFGKGVSLFHHLEKELALEETGRVHVNEKVTQFQYRVIK